MKNVKVFKKEENNFFWKDVKFSSTIDLSVSTKGLRISVFYVTGNVTSASWELPDIFKEECGTKIFQKSRKRDIFSQKTTSWHSEVASLVGIRRILTKSAQVHEIHQTLQGAQNIYNVFWSKDLPTEQQGTNKIFFTKQIVLQALCPGWGARVETAISRSLNKLTLKFSNYFTI